MPEISLEVEITLTLEVEYTFKKGREATLENPGWEPQVEDLHVYLNCGAFYREDVTICLSDSQEEKLTAQILEHERSERYA